MSQQVTKEISTSGPGFGVKDARHTASVRLNHQIETCVHREHANNRAVLALAFLARSTVKLAHVSTRPRILRIHHFLLTGSTRFLCNFSLAQWRAYLLLTPCRGAIFLVSAFGWSPALWLFQYHLMPKPESIPRICESTP